MKQRMLPTSPVSRAVLAFMATALLVALVGPSFASSSDSATASLEVPTIFIKGTTTKSLRFVGPKTINEGEELRIVNQTNAHKVGPQTFTLVEASEIPKTKKDRELCLKKGHICKTIMSWHGVQPNGSAKVNPVEAGGEGWETPGTLKTKGDSWFTGTKAGASFEQPVAAGALIEPITLTFISAFDPSLHGSIKVLPLD